MMRKTWYAWIPEGQECDGTDSLRIEEVEHPRDGENDADYIYGEYAPSGWQTAAIFGQGLTKEAARAMVIDRLHELAKTQGKERDLR